MELGSGWSKNGAGRLGVEDIGRASLVSLFSTGCLNQPVLKGWPWATNRGSMCTNPLVPVGIRNRY